MDSASPQTGPPNSSRRSVQLALAVFVAVLIGVAAFRGYGNRLGARPSEALPSAKLDLNTADRVELAQLPGMSAERANAIVERRTAKPFRTLDELATVPGFGPATIEKLRPYVRIAPAQFVESQGEFSPPVPIPRSSAIKKIQPGEPPIDVNAASADELQRLPGVGPVTAQHIIAARPYKSVNDLDRAKGIGPKTLEKVRPFVVVK